MVDRPVLAGRHGASDRSRVQRPARHALFSARQNVLPLLPFHARLPRPQRPALPPDGNQRGMHPMSRGHPRKSDCTHKTRRQLRRKQLLQLPHAAHNLRPAQRDPQPPNRLAQRGCPIENRARQRLQSLPHQPVTQLDQRALGRVVQPETSRAQYRGQAHLLRT